MTFQEYGALGRVTKLGDARVDGEGLRGCLVVTCSSPGGAWVVPVLLEIAGDPFAGNCHWHGHIQINAMS